MDILYYLKIAFNLTFTTVEFGVFFAIVMLGVLLSQKQIKRQNAWLLAASYFFYASWDPRFLALIVLSTFVDYLCGIKIHGSEDEKERKGFLLASLFANLSILFVFKYFNFFIESFSLLSTTLGLGFNPHTVGIILPVGISFFTFQSMSYTIDIYRRKLAPTHSFLNFALYVAIFPQLVAGPIEKARELLPQIETPRLLKWENISFGFYLFMWGLFKKLVVADNLSDTVNMLFGYETLSGADVWIASLAFAFQIYGDFSGYTDMARGVAKMMGFNLSLNFNLPYFSKNMQAFWKRWHITLSSWIHEYLYISLGGNRHGKLLTYRNLFLSMTLSGLWHGAAFNFVLWGMYHAACLAAVKLGQDVKSISRIMAKVPTVIKILITFVFTLYGWMLFRVGSMKQIGNYTYAIFTDYSMDATSVEQLAITLFYSAMIFIPQLFQYFTKNLNVMYDNYYVRVVFLTTIFLLILIFGGANDQEFIYFQF